MDEQIITCKTSRHETIDQTGTSMNVHAFTGISHELKKICCICGAIHMIVYNFLYNKNANKNYQTREREIYLFYVVLWFIRIESILSNILQLNKKHVCYLKQRNREKY
jgi:hypothetical protein